MTTTVILASEPGRFKADGLETRTALHPLYCHRDRNPAIARVEEGEGYLFNRGPNTVRIEYRARTARVGPSTDYLAPGEGREIGIGPSVTWHLIECE